MILLLALAAGLLVGFGWARGQAHSYQPPHLKYLWLVFVAFLPQFIAVYLPSTRNQTPDGLAAVCLVLSQTLLLGFAWLNRRAFGMPVLICGALLNAMVMTANGGFMPISPDTASRLIPEETQLNVSTGDRFGTKDILLDPKSARLEWLSDRFLPPAGFPYQVAFSVGDVLIAAGVFMLLAYQRQTESLLITKGSLT